MVEEIGGTGYHPPDRLSPSGKPRTSGPEGVADARKGAESPEEVVVSSELRELIDRVRQADIHRKERVHQVLEKLQRGELVTSEAVREAAERILRQGT